MNREAHRYLTNKYKFREVQDYPLFNILAEWVLIVPIRKVIH
jgi:hypothetical protein